MWGGPPLFHARCVMRAISRARCVMCAISRARCVMCAISRARCVMCAISRVPVLPGPRLLTSGVRCVHCANARPLDQLRTCPA